MRPEGLRIAVATGSRAEFGLLAPVMRAIQRRDDLDLAVITAGAHFLPPAPTVSEVRVLFEIAADVPMQTAGDIGRAADARALGRGVSGMADAFARVRPDWLVVLGDRIEAFAGAAAASVAGIPVAHLHGGDRAEGVADEAMRHAITKLAHLHLPATAQSADRIRRMGEDPSRIHIIGSPAIDGLDTVATMGDAEAGGLGDPDVVFLMHPIGDDDGAERRRALTALDAIRSHRVLALHPNHDPGRPGIMEAIRDAGVRDLPHLPRERFLALLKRLAQRGGAIVGNSSAGLIEAAALRLPAVDIGEREAGRERAGNCVWTPGESSDQIREALGRALEMDRRALVHPYGDGRAGERAAAAIVEASREGTRRLLRKRCAY